jgi:hypothetical protein
MQNLMRMLLVGWAIGTVQLASAMNYSNTDLLLVFRKDGFNDVEFDIGPVTNFVGLAQGTTKSINYDAGLVKTNFNNSLTDVRFLFLAATGLGDPNPRVWVSDSYLTTAPTDVTVSKFSQIRSKISAVGMQATVFTASNSMPAVVPSGLSPSFTFIASDGNITPPGVLGGLTGFPVETTSPGTLKFYEVHIGSAPQPPAPLIGSFTSDATGAISFTAGNVATVTAPTISAVSRTGTTTTVSFGTVAGLKYQLTSAATVLGPFSSVGNPITGDGNAATLTDTSSDAVRFYQIQTSN